MQRLYIVVPWHGKRELDAALAMLTALNMRALRERPLPPLLKSDVRYRREKRDKRGNRLEAWLTAHDVYARGFGDCEDLACILAAQRRLLGQDAIAKAFESPGIGWHIKVVGAHGTITDPSKLLGMNSGQIR